MYIFFLTLFVQIFYESGSRRDWMETECAGRYYWGSNIHRLFVPNIPMQMARGYPSYLGSADGRAFKEGGKKEMGKSSLIIYHIQQHTREQHLSTYYGNYAEVRRERKLEIYMKAETCVWVASPLS